MLFFAYFKLIFWCHFLALARACLALGRRFFTGRFALGPGRGELSHIRSGNAQLCHHGLEFFQICSLFFCRFGRLAFFYVGERCLQVINRFF